MPVAMIAALFFTVALLFTTAYFIFGSIPLLVLKHDTPFDARFIRGFFGIYYVAAVITATATCLSYAWAGHPAIATGAAGLVLLALALRKSIIPRMQALGDQMQSQSGAAIAAFRKTHGVAIAINIVQLVAIVWCLIAAHLQV